MPKLARHARRRDSSRAPGASSLAHSIRQAFAVPGLSQPISRYTNAVQFGIRDHLPAHAAGRCYSNLRVGRVRVLDGYNRGDVGLARFGCGTVERYGPGACGSIQLIHLVNSAWSRGRLGGRAAPSEIRRR